MFAALAIIVSLLVTSTSHEAIKNSAYIYFGIACFVLVLCLVSVFFLRVVSEVQWHNDTEGMILSLCYLCSKIYSKPETKCPHLALS